MARIAREADVYFHTDAVQAAGKVPIDVEPHRLRSADDLRLTKCTGRREWARSMCGAARALRPMLHGGRHERGRRAGTENLAGIVGLGKAAELAAEWLAEGGAEQHGGYARPPGAARILGQVERTRVNSGEAARVPEHLQYCFRGHRGRGAW